MKKRNKKRKARNNSKIMKKINELGLSDLSDNKRTISIKVKEPQKEDTSDQYQID